MYSSVCFILCVGEFSLELLELCSCYPNTSEKLDRAKSLDHQIAEISFEILLASVTAWLWRNNSELHLGTPHGNNTLSADSRHLVGKSG